jgi:hypothetical protein
LNVKITVKGPEDRRVQHAVEMERQDELHHVIGVALKMYDEYYPDAPPLRKTIEIDPAWNAPQFRMAREACAE